MVETNDSMQVVSTPRLLTIEELSGLLQVPKSWIYDRTRMSEGNGFPVLRVGKYLRFDYQRVLEWLKG
jgi:excisionase family DNA binding protein